MVSFNVLLVWVFLGMSFGVCMGQVMGFDGVQLIDFIDIG